MKRNWIMGSSLLLACVFFSCRHQQLYLAVGNPEHHSMESLAPAMVDSLAFVWFLKIVPTDQAIISFKQLPQTEPIYEASKLQMRSSVRKQRVP